MALGNSKAMRPQEPEPTINITSMMDMFTIIVFFLLFSYAAKPDEFSVDKNVELPESNSVYDYSNSVKLFLSDVSIKIEEDIVAQMKNGKVVGLDPANPERSSLYQKLKSFKEKQLNDAKLVALETGEKAKDDFHVLFFCDRNLPFKTMNSIIKVAAAAGYPNFQLAVMER